ncbi:MAG: dienelactone hydrolase family protein [Armatimonadota bacterium]|nr:dienelactone hydrolase family protein [Armatimonadota bacterium]
MIEPSHERIARRLLSIPAGRVTLEADLAIPESARGVVAFAHGTGSSRHSPRNRFVARVLRDAGLATLLADLLTVEEEALEAQTRHLRFDIPLLAERLADITAYLATLLETQDLPLGYFGASTGAAAALVAAAEHPERVRAIVSRGGRPDLAGDALPQVRAPTLLIVGGADVLVLDLNRAALERLATEKALEIVPGATHLFEEPGALDQVARLAASWFDRHLGRPS